MDLARHTAGMSTVMLLREGLDGSYVETRDARLRDRLATHLRGTRLDRQLAAGGSPDASVRLALRARLLVRVATRVALARRVRDVIDDAERGPAFVTTRMPVCRRKVLLARPQLDALGRRLLAAGPVTPGGVALAGRLLRDGAGPIYARPDADDLAVAAEAAWRALDPWSGELDDPSAW